MHTINAKVSPIIIHRDIQSTFKVHKLYQEINIQFLKRIIKEVKPPKNKVNIQMRGKNLCIFLKYMNS